MKALARIITAWLGAGAIALGAAAEERQPQSLQQLLEFVQQGQAVDAREAREREARFVADKAGRQAELARARALRAEQQKRSAALEKRFEANERELEKTQARLRERLGSLGVPVVAGLPVGHARRNDPVVLGLPTRVEATSASATVVFSDV